MDNTVTKDESRTLTTREKQLADALRNIASIVTTRPPEDGNIPFGEWYYNQLMLAQYEANQALKLSGVTDEGE
jgi:hypothetical protein